MSIQIQLVSVLRQQLMDRHATGIPKKPGFYRWWFREDKARLLLQGLSGIDWKQLNSREEDGKRYLLLYVGISNDLYARARWHILQKHTPTAVNSGRISTLRYTLGALLGQSRSQSESVVNDFIDEACYFEWEELPSLAQAEEREKKYLSAHSGYYLPLNIQGNKTVPKEIVRQVKRIRSLYK